MQKKNFCLFFVAIMVICGSASAQGLDPTIVVRQLAPGNEGPMVRTLKKQNALTLQRDQPIPASFDFAALDVPVEFDGDSHLLTANGMIALRSVATALADPGLADQVFQVGAHVSLVNDAGRSVQLSALRANTVVEHLTVFYDIPGSRLVPVGYGASKPLNPAAATSPENTRIEFINISGL